MQETYNIINKDPQIWKFSFYGFFKNLKFFEPFLIIFLMQSGLNLFQIGLLYSVREIMSFVFEIPSGILADNYGKKKELLLCFAFYIFSFTVFFFSTEFWQFSIAMIFFGLGEAFRSGTHKAMIMTYLEEKNWFMHKNFVYGKTRSFSMIGSAFSSILSIVFLFQFEQLKFLFIICVIPYIADMILIASYPASLDVKVRSKFNFKEFFSDSVIHFKRVLKSTEILKTITSSSFFDATFSSIKDYIQPILAILITSSTLVLYFNLDEKQTLKFSLAVIYMIIYIFSAYASRNVYKLNKKRSSARLMGITMNILGFTSLFIAFSVNFNLFLLIALSFFFLYILKNVRRPMFVDVISDIMEKDQRATVLSVENQLTAIFTIVFAPVFGFIADNSSFTVLFMIIAVLAFVMNFIARVPEKR
ncbi:MAG: MFS transporter [Candidatus Delongbacteria bacterium]|nr:MFS transporter [Candidatus Delongbacteria bacterium]